MMSPWRAGHLFALFLLLYVTADLMDPFTPGVFFFDKETFFVDGAVQFKSTTAVVSLQSSLIPSGNPAVLGDAEDVVVKVRTAALCPPQLVALLIRPAHESSSSGSAPPPDSTPASPLA